MGGAGALPTPLGNLTATAILYRYTVVYCITDMVYNMAYISIVRLERVGA